MEEKRKENNALRLQVQAKANDICQEATIELLQLKGQRKSKSFFVSTAHQFLQKLIHLHCAEIKQALALQARKFQNKMQDGCSHIELDKMMQDLKIVRDHKQDGVFLNKIDRVFGYLIEIQCQGKSQLEIQNIFLEINCSLNYTCPICIKKLNSNEPRSIKLIKNQSQQYESLAEPRTTKTISLREIQKSDQLPTILKQSKFESILNTMKAERANAKKQQETKQKKMNKLWSMIGNLMHLDKQKYIVDHIFNDQRGKENRLYHQLQQKNTKNQHCITHFIRKPRRLIQIKPQKIDQQTENLEIVEKSVSLNRQVTRSVSPKFGHRKLSVKKQVNILSPIQNNESSQLVKKAIQKNKVSNSVTMDLRTYKMLLMMENEGLKTNSKQKKVTFCHRSFKSSKDVFSSITGEGSSFSEFAEKRSGKQIKLIQI